MAQIVQSLAPDGQKRPARINPRILLLALGMFALGTDAFVVAGVLPVIAHETGITVSVAGQLVTAFSLTYGLGAPLLAVLVSRLAPHRVLIASLGLFCLANVASAFAPTFPILLLTRILTGCFAAIYAPQAYTMGIALAPPEKRGQALALVVIGLTVATALGSPLGTWVGELFGWRFSFGLVAGLAGIGFLAFLLSGLPRISAPPAASLRQRLAPITQPRLVLALLPTFLWNLGIYTIYTYIGPLLQQNIHIMDISGMLVAYGLGVVLGSWSGGMIADRVGPTRPLILSLVLLLVIEIVLPLVTTTWLGGVLMLFAWALLGALLFVPQQHRLLSVTPEHANVILALNNSMLYLGIAGGATVGGLALHAIAVTQLGWIGGPVCSSPCCCYL
ncbi:MFS transporter [Ktedonospora formicarum]|uniref:MFS transporter n=1 Tax=Ktedonospora formicarum TaxID=2778364 RepID=A0A8J3I8B2_9CHLR|nr:MFS transporter [Ktedonospora formicarum]GHO50481.1 MFS transporter [Ktedonospora formicarum]